MFGLPHSLTDSSLYLLHDMLEGILQNAERTYAETSKENSRNLAQLAITIEYYKQELQKFEEDITKQRRQFFQFSIEELYAMYGQYDEFVSIEFHKFSDVAKKFGRNISGTFLYGKGERKELDSTIHSEKIPRTNGLVKVIVSSNCNLTDEQIRDLRETGINCGDIYEILAHNIKPLKVYAQKEQKEIPNTITVNIDTRNTDACKLTLFNLNMRLDNGETLIQDEWDKYFGYYLYYFPEIKENRFLQEKICIRDGEFRTEVRLYELKAKYLNSDINNNELDEMFTLLKNRRAARIEMLKVELKKAGINSLEKFCGEHIQIYNEVFKAALTFEDSVFTHSKSNTPVYWDFKSYLHIFLRHCDELQPSGHFKTKTSFAYKQEDIRRLLAIAVKSVKDKIESRLNQGLCFRIYGEKALYFNGNYYSLTIEKSGRISSFHPNE